MLQTWYFVNIYTCTLGQLKHPRINGINVQGKKLWLATLARKPTSIS
uniref:Uncharacterized protein n=1 Tax=Anguilla anguilla TaxID=7936 RepID=A0A0E9SXY0_ANGAN